MPLITLTARKASPNRLELRYADALSQSTIDQTPLAPLLGMWINASETTFYAEVGLGQYEVLLRAHHSGDTLFHYQNAAIRMWKTDTDFLRPKWGIYRSLNDSISLRDESVFFADISIEEMSNSVSVEDEILDEKSILFYPNPARDELRLSDKVLRQFEEIRIYNHLGQVLRVHEITSDKVSISDLSSGIYHVQFRTKGIRSRALKLVIL